MNRIISLFFLISFSFSLSAQSFLASNTATAATVATATAATSSPIEKADTQSSALFDTTRQILLAISSKDYPVTPGDVYILSYLSRDVIVNLEFLVPYDYELNLKDLGIVDSRGMTFYALKRRVEDIFNRAYPGSFPTLSLRSVGFFHVPIVGALPETKYSLAWGLSRLGEIIDGLIDVKYSSIRDIKIISSDGSVRSIDYFKAVHLGDLSQDPIVKQGDTIRIGGVQRVVQVEGEFVKPGLYQLLPGEDWHTLLNYSGGVTDTADMANLSLYRNKEGLRSEKISFDPENPSELKDGDHIVVSPVLLYGGYLSIDGALITDGSSETTTIDINTTGSSDGRETMVNEALQFPFVKGETLRDVLLKAASSFSPDADLNRCLFYRSDEISSVDVRTLLFQQTGDFNPVMEDGDRLFIPQEKVYVSVQGAVISADTILYQPGESVDYYIQMAGGINPFQSRGDFQVLDAMGNRKKTEDLAAGDTVYVPQNSFAYNFTTYLPIITTTLALITSVISVFTTLQN